MARLGTGLVCPKVRKALQRFPKTLRTKALPPIEGWYNRLVAELPGLNMPNSFRL